MEGNPLKVWQSGESEQEDFSRTIVEAYVPVEDGATVD